MNGGEYGVVDYDIRGIITTIYNFGMTGLNPVLYE
uniref:Uncharacterized protein n=1 Tax=Heterorhabditis bacteriophora TaxID=37862 RepID=A0A1I7WC45_HETBA